ncbi:MAG: penicillin-binding protein activator [Bdellovibrionales bacterium]|nr:penicillin-binding protein activator [Bdellovibrionales bacterium]
MKTLRTLLVIFVVLIGWIGCSGVDEYKPSPYPDSRENPRSNKRFSELPQLEDKGEIAAPQTTSRYPWDTYALQRDLEGQPLRNLFMLEGDQLYQVGRLQEAVQKFETAQSSTLTAAERDALVIRLGSAYLALDRAEDTLRLLSDHFRTTQRSEDSVGARFSLLFAYSYGRLAKFDQSLAWFSRAFRLEAGRGLLSEVSKDGVLSLLRAVPGPDFDEIALVWGKDAFVASLIGKERLRRSKADYTGAPTEYVGQFWTVDSPGFYGVSRSGEGRFQLAVLLPLSGKFSRLGESAKRGIELALLGQGSQRLIQPLFQDTAGESLTATAAVRGVLAQHPTNLLILGPLLSDVATDIAPIALRAHVPLLSFSKRSFFQTGDGIYRLGPTIESQIDSLVVSAKEVLGLHRLAMVRPEGPVGDYYAEVFRRKVAEVGLELVYDTSVNSQDASQLVSVASEVEGYDPDAIFFPDDLVPAGRFYSSLSSQLRSRVRLLGMASWDDPIELKRSRTVLEGIVFVSPYFQDSERLVVQKFNETFQKSYGTSPDFLAAQGFDAATLLVAALRQSLESGVSFEQVMREIEDYDGLTGKIHVAPNGELVRRFAVVKMERQRLAELPMVSEIGAASPNIIMRGNEVVSEPIDFTR